MNALQNFVAFAYHKVALTGAVFEVVNIPAFMLTFTYEVDQNNSFQTPAEVLPSKCIFPLVHHGNINGIYLFLRDAHFAFRRKFFNSYQQVCLFKVGDIVAYGVGRFEIKGLGKIRC